MASGGSHNDYVGCGKHMIGERMARCQFGTSLVRAFIQAYKYIVYTCIYIYSVTSSNMCFFRSILHGRMTFCHVADSPKFGAQQQRLLGQRSHLGEKIHVGSFGRANFAKGPRSLMVSWDSLMENIKPCFFSNEEFFLLQQKMAPEERSEAPIAWRMNIHPM